jgi:acetyl-CoA carboxylase carboxyl transferase subunit alpha
MSKRHFLEFEQPIAELESKIDELRYVQNESAVDISEEIERLGKKSLQLTKDRYASLSPWPVTQSARHPQRPYGFSRRCRYARTSRTSFRSKND